MATLWMMISILFMQYDAIPWKRWLWMKESLQKFPKRIDSCKPAADPESIESNQWGQTRLIQSDPIVPRGKLYPRKAGKMLRPDAVRQEAHRAGEYGGYSINSRISSGTEVQSHKYLPFGLPTADSCLRPGLFRAGTIVSALQVMVCNQFASGG